MSPCHKTTYANAYFANAKIAQILRGRKKTYGVVSTKQYCAVFCNRCQMWHVLERHTTLTTKPKKKKNGTNTNPN